MKVDVNIFDYASVSRATRRLDDYYADLSRKADELCRRLAAVIQDRKDTDQERGLTDRTEKGIGRIRTVGTMRTA